MDASWGGTLAATNVDIEVTDGDVAPVREAFDRKYGLARTLAAIAFTIIIFGAIVLELCGDRYRVLKLVEPWALLAFIVMQDWSTRMRLTNIAHTFSMTFSATGFDMTTAFSGRPPRHYSWSAIRVVKETDALLIVVPKFAKRIVLPKRYFSDGGSGLVRKFQEHGVHYRNVASI
jgi:hypothetical protein